MADLLMKTFQAPTYDRTGDKTVNPQKVIASPKNKPANMVAMGCLALSSFLWSSNASVGKDVSFAAEYSLSIAGLPFAKGRLSMASKGGHYAARAKISTWGIAKLVVASKTFIEASGRFGGKRVRPAKYSLDSRTKKYNINVRMGLSGNVIRQLSAKPPLRKLPDRIPVRTRHKTNILDPLSAAIVPYRMKNGKIGKDACRKTVPVFDGWSRFDVKLYFRRFANVRTKAYKGKAAVCGARWVPVAGHRPNKKTVVYLQENKGLETWLIPVPGGNFLIPYRMSIKTKSGTLVIQNKRLVVNGRGKKHARK